MVEWVPREVLNHCVLGVRHIQLDRPGFGLSDFQPGRTVLDWPDDVAHVADLLGIERFAVIGVSGRGPYMEVQQ
jgi:pimeloyl-ACP methyl ester carboxylesterase